MKIPDYLGNIEFLREHPAILEKLVERSASNSLEPFIMRRTSTKIKGGFNWDEQIEGYRFWHDVLFRRKTEVFYGKYSVTKHKTSIVDTTGTTTIHLLTPIQKIMKVFRTDTVKINGVDREVTVAVVVTDNNSVYAGYAIKNPEDETNPELAKTIAEGRALNARTTVYAETLPKPLQQKYILYAIAGEVFRKLRKGEIEIKGVKSPVVKIVIDNNKPRRGRPAGSTKPVKQEVKRGRGRPNKS